MKNNVLMMILLNWIENFKISYRNSIEMQTIIDLIHDKNTKLRAI